MIPTPGWWRCRGMVYCSTLQAPPHPPSHGQHLWTGQCSRPHGRRHPDLRPWPVEGRGQGHIYPHPRPTWTPSIRTRHSPLQCVRREVWWFRCYHLWDAEIWHSPTTGRLPVIASNGCQFTTNHSRELSAHRHQPVTALLQVGQSLDFKANWCTVGVT